MTHFFYCRNVRAAHPNEPLRFKGIYELGDETPWGNVWLSPGGNPDLPQFPLSLPERLYRQRNAAATSTSPWIDPALLRVPGSLSLRHRRL